MYIDTHSHIYLEQFDADQAEMLRRASLAGVTTILMPAIDTATHAAMMAAENGDACRCLSMMGLHPCSVNEGLAKELNAAEAMLKQRKFVAIGETGLDFYWDITHKEAQYAAFRKQIEWGIEYNLPIVIHSRNATDECIEVVHRYKNDAVSGVFHCFGGSRAQAEKIIAAGFYLGIGGVLSFKKSGLDAVLKDIPLDKILLETDAPYLAPVPHRGKRNEPAYIPLIAQKLADVKELSIETIAVTTTKNAEKLFKLTA